MPANGRWDLIRRLKVKTFAFCQQYTFMCSISSSKSAIIFLRKLVSVLRYNLFSVTQELNFYIIIIITITTTTTTTTTAIEFSLVGRSPYTSTDKTNKNNYT